MKITKAILLTALLIVLFYIPQFILVALLKHTDIIGESFKVHTFAIIRLLQLATYLIIFHYFWKPKPSIKAIFCSKPFDFNLVPYLLFIAFGLGFVEQPLFDFEKIISYYTNSEITPYSNPFPGISSFFIYEEIAALFIAPVFEELFFRKFLFKKLLEKNQLWTAIITSSICFASIHFETPDNLIPTFIYGVIACLIYLKTKNIIYPMLMHFFFNFFVMLYQIFGEPFFIWLYDLKFDFMYWAIFLFGILVTVMGFQKFRKADYSEY